MALNMAYNQRPQYLDLDAQPLSAGRVTFLDVGTPDLKSIYADPDAIVELPNPLLLDAGGFVPTTSVFYGEGNYTVLVERVVNPGDPIPLYAEEYTIPIVVGSKTSVALGNVVNVDAVEDLINLDMGLNRYVNCAQYYNREALDSGGGLFKWYPSSTATTDLGMVFAWSGSPAIGRFFRIGDGKSIRTSWYGVTSNTGASMNNRILEAAAYCTSEERPTLEFTEAEIEVVGTLPISVHSVKINTGVRFTQFDGNFTTNIVFSSEDIKVEGVTQPLVPYVSASLSVTFLSPNLRIQPEWLGAEGNGIQDDFTPFYNLSFSTGKIVIAKSYLLTASGSMGSTALTFNQLHLEGTGHIINDVDLITVESCTGNPESNWNFRTSDGDYSNYVDRKSVV